MNNSTLNFRLRPNVAPLVCILAGTCHAAAKRTNRPHILFMSRDDFGPYLNVHGRDQVIPPNLGVNTSLTITAMAERAMSKIPAAAQPWQARYPQLTNGNGANGHHQPKKVNVPVALALIAAAAIPVALTMLKLWQKKV